MLGRFAALLITFLLSAYCWGRVSSKPFRLKTRPWRWWRFSNNKEEDERLYNALDLFTTLIAALLLTATFIVIAGLGYLWE